jgi:hypothetical protein
MQENCLFGSEGGAKLSFVPTPIRDSDQQLFISVVGVAERQ